MHMATSAELKNAGTLKYFVSIGGFQVPLNYGLGKALSNYF
jgi:hypothetical protein